MSAGFALLQRFVRDHSGIALEEDKRYLVESRLQPVMRDAKIINLEVLAQKLNGDPRSDLTPLVIEALTINETLFFRDRALFTAFSERLLPAIIAERKEQKRLRIWCAGCSTGQEPYSLAMLIDEHARLLPGWQVEIVATDLSAPVVESARRGVYSQFEVQRGLPVRMLLRYFNQQGDSWRISDYLRSKISFRMHNLMAAPRDVGEYDIIFCRNVLIYFDVAIKRQVLGRLASALAPDGYLVMGAAERVGGLSDVLKPATSEPFVFVKNAPVVAAQRRPMLAAQT